MAPCTNASSAMSGESARRRAATSSRRISRASTTRVAPVTARSASAAGAFNTLSCVLKCSARPGTCLRSSAATPTSATMAASTPASSASRAVSTKSESSPSVARALIAA